MPVTLTGRDLTRDELVRVALAGEPVILDPDAVARMAAAREVVEERLRAGDAIYGGSTAVGVLKRTDVGSGAAGAYSSRMIRQHMVAQGEDAAGALVRATALRLANGFAAGYPGVRPMLAKRLVDALNAGDLPRIRVLGSVGQSDLAQMADLAAALFDGVALEAGEGLALVSSNSFSTAAAALAIADLWRLVTSMEVAGALSLEGLAGNARSIDPGVGEARPYPGLQASMARIRRHLDGSALHQAGVARALQDPLSFRNLPQLMGACRDALAHADDILAIELNASQGNPIVLVDERRVVAAANFEILPLAAALDYLRIVLSAALGASAERSVKLLETTWSGLPTGLATSGDPADPGLSYLGIAAQAIAVEARLLAAPVSSELVSTAHAEGIEDRTSLAPLAARRLAEMVGLGARLVAVELTVAAQAVELRGLAPQGRGTRHATELVRRHVPSLTTASTVPDVEPLVAAVRAGAFADSGDDEAWASDVGTRGGQR